MEKFSLTSENLELRKRVAELEQELENLKTSYTNGNSKDATKLQEPDVVIPDYNRLDLDEYKRYGRQMIMSEVGLEGQLQLKRTRALIVGAGGLGCPASVYLAGAGVGTIGIIDHDTVELSNLHRQILHTTSGVGQTKVLSAIQRLKETNPTITYIPHECALTSTNALSVFENYDIVFDCTDLPSTRYLISDACVLLGKTLVSASALRSDGQLVVLNDPPGQGPCYRCVFPRPPPPETVLSCGEGGVLGPVVGTMGVLMAMEGIKVIIGRATRKPRRRSSQTENGVEEEKKKNVFTMLIYSAFSPITPFRSIKMLGQRGTCSACSPTRTITRQSLEEGSLDYAAFCGAKTGRYPILAEDEQVDVQEYNKLRREGKGGLLIDVRDQTQFNLCSIGGTNVPITTILSLPNTPQEGMTKPAWLPADLSETIYIVCKLGNDSRTAVDRLKRSGLATNHTVKDIKGGLWEWQRRVDKDFPLY